MLDIKFIRENKAVVKQAAKNKNIKIDINQLLKLDDEKRKLQAKIEELRAKRNEIAKSARGGKPTAGQIKQGKELKEEISDKEETLKKIGEEYGKLIYSAPNLISEDTPIGP
ncbi:serine--tRNA ligase, partial [Candidatus Parcubacteria bacterium]|nr:serine--tRNA ligase [Candidatus Parcubacteria bacterium]